MRRSALLVSFFLAIVLPARAEEFVMKDGTKIVGRMVSVKGDTIEVETSYGKLSLKRSEIVTINFPENKSAGSNASDSDKPGVKIDDSLVGQLYSNKTANFILTVPLDWKLDPGLVMKATTVAGLESSDSLRYLMVVREFSRQCDANTSQATWDG